MWVNDERAGTGHGSWARPGGRPPVTVELLAGTPPGGGQDRAARALALALSSVMDVDVSVINVPGRGGANAWSRLRDRPGDPCRLAISSPTLITNPLTGVDGLGAPDLTAVATLCTEHIAFAVAADGPVADAAGLLAALATGGTVAALATARGNVNHIALAWLGRHLGHDARNLPVRVFGSARHAIAAVLAGGAGVTAVSAASVLPEVADRTLRVVAVSAPARLTAPLDAVPTWQELGVACTIGTWRGVVAGRDVPPDAVAWWSDAVGRATRAATWRRALNAHAWSDTYLDAASTRAFLAQQWITLGGALADLGLIAT